MSDKRYQLAGWLAVITAIVTVPSMGLLLLFQKLTGTLPIMASFTGLFHIVFLAVSIYILIMFKELLNKRYEFHKTDILIIILIVFNVLSGIIGLMGLFTGLESFMTIMIILMLVPFGVINVIFAVRLLEMGDGLYGFLRPYAYLKITEGICAVMSFLLPVVFMVLGLIVGITSVFLLGMIFLRTKDELEFV
jgi:hypothetical protein